MPHGGPHQESPIQQTLMHRTQRKDPTGMSVNGPDPANPGSSIEEILLGEIRRMERLDSIIENRIEPTSAAEYREAEARADQRRSQLEGANWPGGKYNAADALSFGLTGLFGRHPHDEARLDAMIREIAERHGILDRISEGYRITELPTTINEVQDARISPRTHGGFKAIIDPLIQEEFEEAFRAVEESRSPSRFGVFVREGNRGLQKASEGVDSAFQGLQDFIVESLVASRERSLAEEERLFEWLDENFRAGPGVGGPGLSRDPRQDPPAGRRIRYRRRGDNR